MTDSTGSEPKMTTGLSAGAWLRGLVKAGVVSENEVHRAFHSHQFDDEPPVQTDENGNLYPYMCRACETETGDPYAWVERERG